MYQLSLGREASVRTKGIDYLVGLGGVLADADGALGRHRQEVSGAVVQLGCLLVRKITLGYPCGRNIDSACACAKRVSAVDYVTPTRT